MTPEEIAILFHETYERLAPQFGYETRKETRAFDPVTPNGRLMIAVCGQVANAIVHVAVVEEREASALEAEQYANNYPLDVFIEPPPGKHGQTVAACSARAARTTSKNIAAAIRARANTETK